MPKKRSKPALTLSKKLSLPQAVIILVLAVAVGYAALHIFAASPESATDLAACTKSTKLSSQKASVTALGVGQASTTEAATVTKFVDADGSMTEQRTPPANWKPLSATDDELAYYGFPPRPTGTKQLAGWKKTFSNYSGFADPGDCVTNLKFANYSSYNWTGYVAKDHSNYNFSQTIVKVPHTVFQCPRASTLGIWTGLGGYGSEKLIQNGIDDAGGTANHWTWFWEILPDKGHVVNGSVSPGQSMLFTTSYSNGQAKFYWYNRSTGQTNNVVRVNGINGKTVAQLYDGHSAETIVERAGGDLRKWDSGDMILNAAAGYSGSSHLGIQKFHYDTQYMVRPNSSTIVANTVPVGSSAGDRFNVHHVRCE